MLKFVILLLLALEIGAKVLKLKPTYHVGSAQERLETKKQLLALGAHPKIVKLYMANFPNDYIILPVSIGTPPQNFNLSIESGTGKIWALDKSYPYTTLNQSTYNYDKSSTFTRSSDYDSFGDYSGDYLEVYGSLYYDFVNINDWKFNQSFGGVYSITKRPFSSGIKLPFDGVIGFSPDLDDIKGGPTANPVNNLLVTVGAKMAYNVWIGPHIPPSQGSPDIEITLGGYDDENCKSADLGFSTQLYKYERNNDIVLLLDTFSFEDYFEQVSSFAQLDSGFPLLRMPATAYRHIFKTLKPEYDWDRELLVVDCDQGENHYPITIEIGEIDYYIVHRQYIVDLEIGNGKCALAIDMSQNDYDKVQWTLGSPFLRTVCQYYDLEKKTITFIPNDDTPEVKRPKPVSELKQPKAVKKN